MQRGVRMRYRFSPTSLVEGVLDLFISAAEAHQSNSSEHLPERLYTALALSHDLWALVGGPCVVRITRDLPTGSSSSIQHRQGLRLSLGGQLFFLFCCCFESST